jgi:cell division septal protein FtsQ
MLSFKIRKLRRLFILLLAITLISGSSYLLGWSSVFTVSRITVEGSNSRSEIFRKLNSDSIELAVGSKLARIETRAIKRSIGMLDWIDEVNVSRDWFDKSINLSVREKKAVAKAITTKNGLINFDVSGEIFKPISASQQSIQERLPLVITEGNDSAQLASVASLLAQMPTQMADLILNLKSISVANSGYIQMETKVNELPLRIDWGLVSDIDLKIEVLNALLKLPENKRIKRVDLSQPELPIVS